MTGPLTPAPSTPTPGKGLVVAGAVLVAVAVFAGLLGTVLLGSRLGLEDLQQRDVATKGSSDRLVPGTIAFTVNESLDEGVEDGMTVAVGINSADGPEPTCSITGDDGRRVALDAPLANQPLMDPEYSGYRIVGSAWLTPGDYEATCRTSDERSSRTGASFAVGRSFGMRDVTAILGPLVGLLITWGVAALVFIVGVVLLIVGLVRRSRSQRRPDMGGPSPGAPPPPVQYPGPAPYQPTQPQPPTYQPPQPPSGPAAQPPTAQPPTAPPHEGSVDGWTIPPSKR